MPMSLELLPRKLGWGVLRQLVRGELRRELVPGVLLLPVLLVGAQLPHVSLKAAWSGGMLMPCRRLPPITFSTRVLRPSRSGQVWTVFLRCLACLPRPSSCSHECAHQRHF